MARLSRSCFDVVHKKKSIALQSCFLDLKSFDYLFL